MAQICLFCFRKRGGDDKYLIIVLEVTTLCSNHLEQIQSEIYFYFADGKNEALRD